MHWLRALWRSFFDVREGEGLRTLFMGLYLMLVLFAYYILKPLSRSLFLNKFDIDKLPYLYILIAVAGGLLAYVYTKVALHFSLQVAVTSSMVLTVVCLVGLWWLIGLGQAWVLYAFNIWVSLFSVMLVSQGWLVAANVFTSREAKRLYGLLGMGAVAGAAFGGTFIAQTVSRIGSRNQLLASAALVVLAYVAFLVVVRQKGVSLVAARGAEAETEEFQFKDILLAIGRHKHLQVIIGIITVTFIVDVTIEYQFNAMAKLAYKGDKLTAFLGTFYGIYLNLITLALQFFLTGVVVRRLGVGGTLQIMPVTLSLASVATFFIPGVTSSASLRLLEAASRYTLNRTGMELLYLPLPAELRNRTKAFVDIFVDRMGRGLGGMVLIFFTAVLALKPTQIALVTAVFSLAWMALSRRASREYLATVRGRLASRRLDLTEARVSCDDPQTVALIEQTAAGENPRQAVYALSLLAETTGYELTPLLEKLAASRHAEVRARVYELARARAFDGLIARAKEEHAAAGDSSAEQAAAAYLVGLSVESAKTFLNSPNIARGHGALDALAAQPSLAAETINAEWLRAAAADPDPRKRVLVARAAGLAGGAGASIVQQLLEDADSSVVRAACAAAGVLRNRAHVFSLTRCLTNARQRGAAIAALAEFGPRVCGTLSDILADETVPAAMRRQIPRVLKLIPDQRSVDILLQAIDHSDPGLRRAVLKALNRLRESAPKLSFEDSRIAGQMQVEVRRYCELNAALDPFRSSKNSGEAAGLLARSLDERMAQTLDHLFRLLGLRYPQQEIYSAYRAVSGRSSEAHSAAVEFLDSVLERDMKRLVVPLLDAPERLLDTGRNLLGIQPKTAETALRELLHSGDSWLAACAAAAAGEMKLRGLAPDITEAGRIVGDVGEVARAAAVALA
ncbi:MAG: hypothetical protein HYX25_03540 [Candidatus Solibacter usitatus]|nr:hypothetical protein [Candidatus Solibacter usitatus]